MDGIRHVDRIIQRSALDDHDVRSVFGFIPQAASASPTEGAADLQSAVATSDPEFGLAFRYMKAQARGRERHAERGRRLFAFGAMADKRASGSLELS